MRRFAVITSLLLLVLAARPTSADDVPYDIKLPSPSTPQYRFVQRNVEDIVKDLNVGCPWVIDKPLHAEIVVDAGFHVRADGRPPLVEIHDPNSATITQEIVRGENKPYHQLSRFSLSKKITMVLLNGAWTPQAVVSTGEANYLDRNTNRDTHLRINLHLDGRRVVEWTTQHDGAWLPWSHRSIVTEGRMIHGPTGAIDIATAEFVRDPKDRDDSTEWHPGLTFVRGSRVYIEPQAHGLFGRLDRQRVRLSSWMEESVSYQTWTPRTFNEGRLPNTMTSGRYAAFARPALDFTVTERDIDAPPSALRHDVFEYLNRLQQCDLHLNIDSVPHFNAEDQPALQHALRIFDDLRESANRR